MKLKRILTILVTTMVFFITVFGATYANASKWHNGVPKFLVNTTWKSNMLNYKYDAGSDGIVNANISYTYSYGINDYNLNIIGTVNNANKDSNSKSNVNQKYHFNNFRYYKVSKNTFKLSYTENDDSQTNGKASTYMYKVNKNTISFPSHKQEDLNGPSSHRIYLYRVN